MLTKKVTRPVNSIETVERANLFIQNIRLRLWFELKAPLHVRPSGRNERENLRIAGAEEGTSIRRTRQQTEGGGVSRDSIKGDFGCSEDR